MKLFILLSAILTLSNGDYTLDTIAHMQVGPGTYYTAVRLTQANGKTDYPVNAFITQVDARNPYIQFESVLAKDSIIGTECPSAMAKRHSKAGHLLFAGTNADFFTTKSTMITEGTDCLLYGRPSGGVIVDHQIATLQSNKRQSFVIDDDKRPYIGAFTRNMKALVNGEELTIYNVNYTRAKDKLTLFNNFNGATTTACTAGTEVLLALKDGEQWGINKEVRLVVEKVLQNNGRMAIPKGKVVLSGNGTMADKLNALSVGDEVVITLDLTVSGKKFDIAHAVGGPDATKYAQMLRDGKVVTDSTWASREPRTGIGYSVTRDTLIFCVLDGRTQGTTGVTTDNEARVMKFFGAYDAMNLDGGGSSCMYISPLGGQVNVPSDGSERACGDGFFAVCTAPDDANIARLVPHEASLVLPKYSYTRPQFYGYNQYDMLINTDVDNVQMTCDPTVGYFMADGKTFTAIGDGDITATYQGITTTIHIHIDNNAQIAFKLDSVLVDRISNYEIEISGLVGKREVGVLPTALTWEADDNSIAAVNAAGQLNGLKNGSTVLTGTIGDFSDILKVNVEIADNEYMAAAYTMDTTVSYTTTRGASLTLEPNQRLFGCPDSLLITFHTTAPIQSMALTFQTAEGESITSGQFADAVPTDADCIYRIELARIVGNRQSIYPLTLSKIRYTLKDAKKNTPYVFSIPVVQCHYRDWQNETGLKETATPNQNDKFIIDGRLIIRTGDRLYDMLGTPVQ